MEYSSAIAALLEIRNKLVLERDSMFSEFQKKIDEYEASIEIISGKTVWQITSETMYDDENPNYIKASIEQI
jgi:hypothetical protein